MIEFRPFRADDLDGLRVNEIAARPFVRKENALPLEGDPSATTMLANGIVVGAAGVAPMGDRGIAWAVISDRKAPLVAMSKRIMGWLEHDERVIEAHVVWNFMMSHRWVRHLGFAMDHARPTQFFEGTMMVRYLYVGRK